MAEVNIGIDNTEKLGSGANKIVFGVTVTNELNKLFTTDLPKENLVIASIQPARNQKLNSNIIQGITLNKILEKDELEENGYIKDTLDELKLHKQYADRDMAPKLYKVSLKWFNQKILNIDIDDFLREPYKYLTDLLTKEFASYSSSTNTGILEIFVLEERCGEGIDKNRNIVINDKFIELLNNLIDTISNIGNTWFTDFKPSNSCPIYDTSGNLINIIALDLDASFTYNYDNIQRDFQNVTSLEIDIEDIKKLCKDMMYLEFMFVLLVWGEQNKTKKQLIVDNLKSKFFPNKLLQIISFISYLSIYQLKKYNEAEYNLKVSNIGSKFPLIYYILKSDVKYNNYGYILIDETALTEWFIDFPYEILVNKIYRDIEIPLAIDILEPDQIFVENPNLKEPILKKLDEREHGYDSDDDRFAYHDYGGKVKKIKTNKNKSKRRKLTKRKKSVKRRYTKRRKH